MQPEVIPSKDIEVRCKDCGQIFVIRKSEQEYCQQRNFPLPKRCPLCRGKRKKLRAKEEQIRDNRSWQEHKEAEAITFQQELKAWDVVSLAEAAPSPDDKVLYIIGNGFDLMHGVKSRYYDFNKSLGKHSRLRFYLEHYLKADDLWANFEEALGTLDVEAMCSAHMIDSQLDDMGAYDEDASAADFFMAAETAAMPAAGIAEELERRFPAWIRTLKPNTADRPLANIIKSGKFLDFNYTEFIETLYGINEDDVCYIHGNRRKKKGKARERLIFGHMPGANDKQYDFEDNWSGLNLSGKRVQTICDAKEIALRRVTDADEELTKYCDRNIEKHKDFFKKLSDINKVITVGHSLYPVDWAYFEEFIHQNTNLDDIEWYFGCFELGDLERISAFTEHFRIPHDKVHIFRTDTIRTKPIENADKQPVQPVDKDKRLGCSDDGQWEVVGRGKTVEIRDTSNGTMEFARIFDTAMNGAVFVDDSICLLVARGIDAGIFLLRYSSGRWNYVRELEEIPHQGLITKRLHRILRDGEQLVFVYQSRVRKYDLNDGSLVFNKGMRKAKDHVFAGKDITEKFIHRDKIS